MINGDGGIALGIAAEFSASSAPASRPRAVGRPYVLLEDAVDNFGDRPEALHTPAEIGDQIVHLARCVDQLRLEQARLVGVFDQAGEAEAQGSNDTIDWLRHNAKLSRTEAYNLRVVGRHVDQLPASGIAVERGQVGFGHLVHMAHNAAFSAGHKRADAFDEPELLNRARNESVGRFRETCRNHRHIQDPEGVRDQEVDAFEARSLTFNSTDDGRYFINVELDPLGYTTVRTAIDARGDRDGKDDPRNRARRLTDGLVDMCLDDMARTAKPSESLAPVHIAITCSQDTFLNRPGSAAAVTEYDALLSGAAVGRLACDASITEILLDSKLLPLGVSKLKRRLCKHEMRALRQRYPRCARPGCRRPSSQCDAHHITPWSRGGKTEINDMMMLCPFHHWQVHEGGWQIARSDTAYVWIPPQFARGPTAPIAV